MSLLTICQNVALQTGFPSPATIIANSSEIARRLLALANLEGRTLARRFNFAVLGKEHTFNTVDAQAAYNFPADFDRFIPMTWWDRGMFWALQGPLTPQEWQTFKSGIVQTGPRKKFRVIPTTGVNQFTLFPTPSAIDAMVFEYISNQWAVNAAGDTFATAFAVDTDTAIIPEYLIELGLRWRFLAALGLPYAEEKAEYERECDKQQGWDGGSRTLNLNDRGVVQLNIQEAGFGQ